MRSAPTAARILRKEEMEGDTRPRSIRLIVDLPAGAAAVPRVACDRPHAADQGARKLPELPMVGVSRQTDIHI